MLRALMLAFGQLHDRAIVRVLLQSLALTLLVFVALGAALVIGARRLALDAAWGDAIGHSTSLATLAALFASIAAAWLLFRAVALPVIGLFADQVIGAVETRHYPAAAHGAHAIGALRSLELAALSLARLLIANLLALPFALLLLVTGIGPLLLLVAVNALLLGRDLGEMVGARHLDRAALRDWLRATRLSRAWLGLVVTLLFMLPLVNLLAPILGAAMATHWFHMRRI